MSSWNDLPLTQRLETVRDQFEIAVKRRDSDRVGKFLRTLGQAFFKPYYSVPKNEKPTEQDIALARQIVEENQHLAGMIDGKALDRQYERLWDYEYSSSFDDGSAAMAEEATYRDRRENLARGALHFGIKLGEELHERLAARYA